MTQLARLAPIWRFGFKAGDDDLLSKILGSPGSSFKDLGGRRGCSDGLDDINWWERILACLSLFESVSQCGLLGGVCVDAGCGVKCLINSFVQRLVLCRCAVAYNIGTALGMVAFFC